MIQHTLWSEADDTQRGKGPEGSLYAALDWVSPIPEFPLPWWDSGAVEAYFEVRDDLLSRLKILRAGERSASFYPSDEAIERFTRRLLECQRNDTRPAMKEGSWCIPEDVRMPSDARVDFVYFPTYIALAWLCLVWRERRDIAVRIPGFDRGLRRAQHFASLRHLRGHGYDRNQECLEAIRLLAIGKVFTVAREAPRHLHSINRLLPELEDSIVNGMPNASEWSRTDPVERGYALELIRGADACDAWVVPGIHREWLDHQREWFRDQLRVALASRIVRACGEAVRQEVVERAAELRTVFDAEKPEYTVFTSRRGIRAKAIKLATRIEVGRYVFEARNEIPPVEWLAPESIVDSIAAIRDRLGYDLEQRFQRELSRQDRLGNEEFQHYVDAVRVDSSGTVRVSIGVAG